MRNLRQLLIRHQSAALALPVGATLFMALPPFASLREAIAASVGLPAGALWLPMALIALSGSALLTRRAIRRIALPLAELAKTVEHGQLGFAFQRRSCSKEEDALKHYIESQGLRSKESEEKIEELEAELDQTEERLNLYIAKKTERDAQIEELEKQLKNLRYESESLKTSKMALELTLENERKSKVGAEVQKRTEEIYAQMERAVAAAARQSIWSPSLVQELKTPISIIHDLSTRLRDSWNETSLARINREIEQITQQSEAQLDLLEHILRREPEALGTPTISPEAEIAALRRELALDGEAESEEAEPISAPSPIGIHLKKENRTTAPSNTRPIEAAQRGLIDTLSGLADEFNAARPDLHIELLAQKGLDRQIEAGSLEPVLRGLFEILARRQADGSIELRAAAAGEDLSFDLRCHGQPRLGVVPDFARAERLARSLGSEVAVDAPSDRELRLSFRFVCGEQVEADALDI